IPLAKGERAVFSKQVDDNNNALFYILQNDKADMKHRAAMELISAILQSDFYNQMRTRQQLGYIVQSLAVPGRQRLSLDFFIQSADYGPAELQKRVDDWLKNAAGILDHMSDDDFQNFQIGL